MNIYICKYVSTHVDTYICRYVCRYVCRLYVSRNVSYTQPNHRPTSLKIHADHLQQIQSNGTKGILFNGRPPLQLQMKVH